jgi:dienelactone hydrolase
VLLALACLATAAVLVVLAIVARSHLPAPTGPYAVGTRILELTDQSRHEDHSADPEARRSVVVQLWYPAEPSHYPLARYKRWREATFGTMYAPLLTTHSHVDALMAKAGAPFAVLLFGHRWNGQRTQNTDLAEELASHGYVVAAIDHPYNSARVQLADGRVIVGNEALEGSGGPTASAADQIAVWNRTLETWTADNLFVLNQLAAMNGDSKSPMHGRLDTDHAGAFGHSFGGAASLRLCGLDPRIKACANLDGWTFGGLDYRTAAQPIMILYEQVTKDRESELATLPTPGTRDDQLDRADTAAVGQSLKAFGGYRVFVAGTQHLDFSDQPLLPPLRRGSYTGPIAPMRIQQIVRESVLQFFDQSLRGEASTLLQSDQRQFSDVTVQRWVAPSTREQSSATQRREH